MALGYLHQLPFFSLNHPFIDEDVVDRIRRLSPFADPVEGAFFIKNDGRWVNERVVGTKNLEGFSPWIARFLTHDKTIGRLFFLANTSQTNSQHERKE